MIVLTIQIGRDQQYYRSSSFDDAIAHIKGMKFDKIKISVDFDNIGDVNRCTRLLDEVRSTLNFPKNISHIPMSSLLYEEDIEMYLKDLFKDKNNE